MAFFHSTLSFASPSRICVFRSFLRAASPFWISAVRLALKPVIHALKRNPSVNAPPHVYWIPLYELLESRGIEVVLANARQLRHVPGRKTDMIDCQWLQLLHSCGLVRGSFRWGGYEVVDS